MEINLSFIIDYIYQRYIENKDNYEECIYDNELLLRESYINNDDNLLSRVKSKLYNFNYKPYILNDQIIYKLAKHIEITSNSYNDYKIGDNLFIIDLKDKQILYYDQNKLLINNNFYNPCITSYLKFKKGTEITTLDILNNLRKYYYDKRN